MGYFEQFQDFFQNLFKVLAFIVVASMGYYLYLSIQIYQFMRRPDQMKNHGLTDLPEFSKIYWVPIATACTLFVFKRQIQNWLVPILIVFCKDQDDMAKLHKRANALGSGLYKTIFYTSSGVIGYLIMKDTPILPWYLGGSGSLDQIFINCPYQKQIPYFVEYSLVQMGYYFEDFFNHLVFKERQSDFWEMNLHHCITITLYSGMFALNQTSGGILISWLHSMSDILTASSRVLSQTIFKVSTVVSFVSCTLVWLYLRNFCIPLVVYNVFLYVNFTGEMQQYQQVWYILKPFLFVLCIMHVYWVILFINMIVTGLRAGNTDDRQRETRAAKKTQELNINDENQAKKFN